MDPFDRDYYVSMKSLYLGRQLNVMLFMLIVFSCCELNIGLVCACMPAMPAFFRRMKQSLATLVDSQDRNQTLKPSLGGFSPSRRRSQGVNLHITTPSLHIKTRDYEEPEEQKKEEAMV